MVRQWQEMFYEERYSEVYLSPDLPDYVKWAEAMGCVGLRAESPEEVAADHRQGQRHRRSPGRGRVPGRLPRRRCSRWCRPASRTTTSCCRRRRTGGRTRCDEHGRRRVGPSHHILSVLVENRSGVLARVASLFARRGYNIFSLAVAPTEDERFSRITIVVDLESASLEQITKQLFKLIEVIKISELDPRRVGRARAAPRHGEGRARDPRPGGRAGDDLRGQDPRRRGGRADRVARRPP